MACQGRLGGLSPAFLISDHLLCHPRLPQSPWGAFVWPHRFHVPDQAMTSWRAESRLPSSLTLVPSANPFAGCWNEVLGLGCHGCLAEPSAH